MKQKTIFNIMLQIFLVFFLHGCTDTTGIPEGITPVSQFNLEKYLGVWHEIARIDHRFEKNLAQVTATYTKKKGYIEVKNTGIVKNGKKKKTSIGKALPAGKKDVAHLKVSFFGNFYSSYIIFYLEPDYSVALVCGHTREYCWILARKPVLSKEEQDKYVAIIKEHGFDINQLTFPKPLMEK
jgi:apolipoprotein D and lipocalin family protein